MKFHLLRILMLQRVQMDGFERRKNDGTPYSREEWLREVFSETVSFLHRGQEFSFVPESDIPENEGSLIVGRIGRQVSVSEAMPPEEKLRPTERTTWKAALLAIDPTSHEDGQKVAIQEVQGFGKLSAIFNSLVEHINRRAEPFYIEANTISDPQSFWDFVSRHEGNITSITFEFVAPNMFGHDDDYGREMADYKEKEKIQRLKLGLQSDEGINPHTPRVRHAVDYTSRGGGGTKARTRTKHRFNSNDNAKVVAIENNFADATLEDLIRELLRRIFRE